MTKTLCSSVLLTVHMSLMAQGSLMVHTLSPVYGDRNTILFPGNLFFYCASQKLSVQWIAGRKAGREDVFLHHRSLEKHGSTHPLSLCRWEGQASEKWNAHSRSSNLCLQGDSGGTGAGFSGAGSAVMKSSQGCWSLCALTNPRPPKRLPRVLPSSICRVFLEPDWSQDAGWWFPYHSSWNSGLERKRDFSGSISLDTHCYPPTLGTCSLLLGPGWSAVQIKRNLGDWECFSRIWHLFNPTEVHKLSSSAKGTCLQAVEANWHSTWKEWKILAVKAKRNSLP